MSAPGSGDRPPRTRQGVRLAGGALALVLVLSACASPPSPPATTSGPTTIPTSAPTAAAVATTAPPTPGPTPTLEPDLPGLPLLWEKSGPVSVKTETYWPAIDPLTANVWVASTFDNRFWIFGQGGGYLSSWGAPGSGPGQFKLTSNDPNPDGVGAVSFAPDGSFFVLDAGNYRVQKFDKAGTFVMAWGSFGTGDGQFASPKGIATDGRTVYVADDPRGDIQAFDTNGRFLRSFPFPFVLFSLGANGNLYVSDGTGVLELDSAGHRVAHFDVSADDIHGGGLAQALVDPSGRVYAMIQDRTGGDQPFETVVFSASGTVLGRWAAGGETAALAPDGSAMYVAYTGVGNSGWPFLRKYALPRP